MKFFFKKRNTVKKKGGHARSPYKYLPSPGKSVSTLGGGVEGQSSVELGCLSVFMNSREAEFKSIPALVILAMAVLASFCVRKITVKAR